MEKSNKNIKIENFNQLRKLYKTVKKDTKKTQWSATMTLDYNELKKLMLLMDEIIECHALLDMLNFPKTEKSGISGIKDRLKTKSSGI